MSLVNGGVESIAAADSRSPPPDAGAAHQSNHLRGGRQGLTPAPSEEENEKLRSASFRRVNLSDRPRAKYRPRDFALDPAHEPLGAGVSPCRPPRR